jgi:hypothetical protein
MKQLCAILLIVLSAQACTKESNRPDNPFDNSNHQQPKDSSTAPDPNSIQGIHANILKPTCANSGCHDGTFEPDFRTVSSSYNTLLYRKPIKNDSAGTFSARVLPGNADMSMLWYRLTVDLGGNSGIMPLVVDPDSKWPSKKAEYLNHIRTWINNGAKDPFGNPPTLPDQPPQVLGMTALVNGVEASRPGRYEPIQIPSGSNTEIWICFADDKSTQDALSNANVNFSLDPGNYLPANAQPLIKAAPGKVFKSVYGQNETYLYRFLLNTNAWNQGDVIWLQLSISDGVNGNSLIPNNDALFYLKKYLAIRFI